MNVPYALSIKQPWAALLVHGLKTIEVRKWPTARRGPILIHAARVPDDRPHGWQMLTPELRPAADLRGGIIGAAEIVECRAYRDQDSFAADVPLHRNAPDWWLPPVLYGFRFTQARPQAFQPYSGWMRFFAVTLDAKSVEA